RGRKSSGNDRNRYDVKTLVTAGFRGDRPVLQSPSSRLLTRWLWVRGPRGPPRYRRDFRLPPRAGHRASGDLAEPSERRPVAVTLPEPICQDGEHGEASDLHDQGDGCVSPLCGEGRAEGSYQG